ncbi:MAG: Alanine dehydrogenase [Candidatus Thorarchaeota archaeon]|nr:MAG: Alanine dehydrogenase [Candidatus Thorarchaeota archaeon]
MIIGSPKEIKIGEARVGMTPLMVRELNNAGHEIVVENGLGELSGHSDTEYEEAGATLAKKQRVFDEAEFIVKFKNPFEKELKYFHEGQILFTYLHLDENAPPSYTESLLNLGITGIAYEWVELDDGSHPLLDPMSHVTGIVVAQKAMDLITYPKGKALMVGHIEPGIPSARVTIVGGGHIGLMTAKTFLGINADVTVVDKHPETLVERLSRFVPGDIAKRVKGVLSTNENLVSIIPSTDILINAAVRRPDFKQPHLITKEMILTMEPGSVVIDATACDKDMLETSLSTTHLDPIYDVEGIIHYCVDNVPSGVARTSTALLTKYTFPYIREIANKGIKKALEDNIPLQRGVQFIRDKFVHEYVAKKKGFELSDFDEALALL